MSDNFYEFILSTLRPLIKTLHAKAVYLTKYLHGHSVHLHKINKFNRIPQFVSNKVI